MDVKTIKYTMASGWSQELPEWKSENVMVLAFGAPEACHDPIWLNDLNRRYGAERVAGCSTAGEIHGQEIEDDSVVVAIVRFAKSRVEFVSAPITSIEESFASGQALARRVTRDGLRALFILSEGLNVNGSALVSGVNEELGGSVIVTGGLAGDGSKFRRTWIIDQGRIRSNLVTAIAFYGEDLRVGHGSRGGWDIFGPVRTVTRSAHNVLYELDNSPALDLYKKYLGERAKELPASGLLFPLQIFDKNSGTTLVRTILGVDEAKQALVFAGDVPEGWSAQFMKANFDRLVEGASLAAHETLLGSRDSTSLAIAISCVGRRLVLGARAVEEVEATLDRLPKGTVQVGFYSYGEISPTSGFLKCELHNQTMTMTTLSEAV